MLYFKDYESFIKASLTHRVSLTESENVARFILHIRQRFFCYEQMDVNNRHFFTTDELISATIQPLQYDYLSLPAFRLIKVVSHIVTNLRSGIVRENELMPIHKANEFNSFSINWLSKRPGRTVREKLSGKKSIMAVRRRMSLDIPENRLVKALLVKMSFLLQKKLTILEQSNLSENMPYEERELLQKCSFFLHSNDSKEIGSWTDLPPNNTLLSDRFYHGAWTAWNDLKRINQQIQADYKNLEQLICNLSVLRLIQVASSCFIFPQIPIFYDWQEHSGMFWSVISHIAGIGEGGILQIDWSQEKSLLLSYCGKTVIITFKSMGIQINGEEKSLKKNFSAVLLYMQLENALKMVCGIDYKKHTLSYKNLPSRVFKGKNAVIDLFTIQPKIIVDKKCEVLPEFLLWQKMYKILPDNKQGKEIVFSVGTAKVLLGDEKSELSTIISAVEDESASKNLFLQRHLSILKKFIKADNLSFLYPDCYNEFQLQAVKQMAKMYYYKVRAVPKSLDVVFRYVKHNMKQFGANDAFILIDRVSSFVSMTIVVSVFDKELKKTVPKTHGFFWEHHPSALFDYDLEAAIGGLTDVEKSAASFFGNELLHCQNPQLFFLSTNDEIVILQDLRNKLFSHAYDISNQLENYIMANSKILKGRKLHIIKLANEISVSEIQLKRIVLDSVSGDVGEGVLYYDELVNRANTISLWRDYLPNISIKRMIGSFDLVKDSTFEYGSVKEKELIINTHFTLPCGQKEYHFQLNMETASKNAVYEAVVRSRAFPLVHDTECKLRMKYTYNADNPYSLQFIPIDRKKAGFAEANVSWEPLIKYRTEDLPFQDLPKGETWESLEQFPNKYSPGETINLLEQLEERIKYLYSKEMGKVLDINIKDRSPMVYLKILSIDGSVEVLRIKKGIFLKNCEEAGMPINYNLSLLKNFWKGTTIYVVGKRIVNRFSTTLNNNDWNDKGRIEKKICIENLPLTIVFERTNFIFNESEPLLPNEVTFYVNTNKISSSNWDITRPMPAFDVLPKGVNVYEVSKIATNETDVNETDVFISHFKTQKNYLLFLMHNIYSNGRTIHDNQCPEKHKNGLLSNIEMLFNTFINLYNNHDFDEYRSYLFSILCIANRDVGNRFYKFLDAYIKKSCIYKMAIPPFLGYALGNYEIPVQKKLFNSLTELHFTGYEHIGLFSVLSRIVWRSDDFLMNAPSTILIRLFEEAVNMVINELRTTRKVRNDLLEYILAVFRLRKKGIREINEKLSLNNPLIANLYSLLEKLILKKRFPVFETRIKLTIEKGGEYYASEIPDLIYALIVCISGTNKENTILISSIDDEDNLVYEQYKVC